MGNSTSNSPNTRKDSSSSSSRKSIGIPEICKKLDEKECVFIAMQGEIEQVIMENNKQAMNSLAAEIAAHIMDINQYKDIKMPSGERGRCQRITYNFEISLAKLKSILNSDTAVMKSTRVSALDSKHIYANSVDPDLVSDLMHFDNQTRRSSYNTKTNTMPSVPDNSAIFDQPSVSHTNSLYTKLPPAPPPPETAVEIFNSVESEFDVLKDLLERPIEDINEYYQMDKGVFYLQVRVKNIEVPQGLPIYDRKFKLLKELAEFRNLLDQKSGELEEQKEIIQEVNTLELLVDSATEKELEGLKARALMYQETIEKTRWDQQHIEKKINVLKKLANILERLAYTVSPAHSLRKSVENLYGSLNALKEELDDLKAKEERESIESIDRVLEQHSESEEDNSMHEEIYGNVEVIRQNLNSKVIPRVRRTISNASDRGTVYVNADVVRQLSANENLQKQHQEFINKRPLPLPRNYDEKIITDLPRHWQRLNEIMDNENISETEKIEVAEIQKHTQVAKNLFERKIRKILDKFEESVDL